MSFFIGYLVGGLTGLMIGCILAINDEEIEDEQGRDRRKNKNMH